MIVKKLGKGEQSAWEHAANSAWWRESPRLIFSLRTLFFWWHRRYLVFILKLGFCASGPRNGEFLTWNICRGEAGRRALVRCAVPESSPAGTLPVWCLSQSVMGMGRLLLSWLCPLGPTWGPALWRNWNASRVSVLGVEAMCLTAGSPSWVDWSGLGQALCSLLSSVVTLFWRHLNAASVEVELWEAQSASA